MYAYIIIYAEFSYISKLLQVSSTRPERAEAPSPGHNGIFKKDFETIEQTMYPIYGSGGITYQLK